MDKHEERRQRLGYDLIKLHVQMAKILLRLPEPIAIPAMRRKGLFDEEVGKDLEFAYIALGVQEMPEEVQIHIGEMIMDWRAAVDYLSDDKLLASTINLDFAALQATRVMTTIDLVREMLNLPPEE